MQGLKKGDRVTLHVDGVRCDYVVTDVKYGDRSISISVSPAEESSFPEPEAKFVWSLHEKGKK